MKKIITVTLLVALVFTMTACSSKRETSDAAENLSFNEGPDESYEKPEYESNKMSLKQYLDSGARVAIYYHEEFGKDDRPEYMYLLEDGNIYYICSGFTSAGNPEWRKFDYPTYGEIAKMTEEDLLAYAYEHKTTEVFYGDDSAMPNESSSVINDTKYQLHIYSDKSGNYFEYEKFDFDEKGDLAYHRSIGGVEFRNLSQFEIYDAVFTLFSDRFEGGDAGICFRTDDKYNLYYDSIGDDGVLVD